MSDLIKNPEAYMYNVADKETVKMKIKKSDDVIACQVAQRFAITHGLETVISNLPWLRAELSPIKALPYLTTYCTGTYSVYLRLTT